MNTIKQLEKQIQNQEFTIQCQKMAIKNLRENLDFVLAKRPWYKLLFIY